MCGCHACADTSVKEQDNREVKSHTHRIRCRMRALEHKKTRRGQIRWALCFCVNACAQIPSLIHTDSDPLSHYTKTHRVRHRHMCTHRHRQQSQKQTYPLPNSHRHRHRRACTQTQTQTQHLYYSIFTTAYRYTNSLLYYCCTAAVLRTQTDPRTPDSSAEAPQETDLMRCTHTETDINQLSRIQRHTQTLTHQTQTQTQQEEC